MSEGTQNDAEGVEKLILLCGRFADEGRIDEMAACFTEDGELHVPGRIVKGREKLGRFFGYGRTEETPAHLTKHILTNFTCEFEGDSGASTVTYFQVLQGTGLSAWGRYIDNVVSHDGQWRIAKREVAVDGPTTS